MLQVADKATKNMRNCQRLPIMDIVSFEDILQLRNEKKAKNQKSRGMGKALVKRKEIASPTPPIDRSDSELCEDQD